MENEEVKRLEHLIKEDNLSGLSNILNSNENLRNNFNTFRSSGEYQNIYNYLMNCVHIYLMDRIPLLHFAVMSKSQKALEYLLSQDFVDKTICDKNGENIYHIVCRLRGEEELFSIIERKVPHNLLYQTFPISLNAFEVACANNNIFIVKRVYEILKSLQIDFTENNKFSLSWALYNQDGGDIEVIKYVLPMGGITNANLLRAIRSSKFEIVIYLLNGYLCQSIPSHLHNHFHIFQFSNHPLFYNSINNNNKNNNDNNNLTNSRDEIENIMMNNNNNDNNNNKHDGNKDDNDNNNNDNNDNSNNNYLILVEENFKKIIEIEGYENKIWHEVCRNSNFDVVQLIFSFKGIQPEIFNKGGFNPFLYACAINPNIKIIKYIHKLFPSSIHTKINSKTNEKININGYFINEDIKNGVYYILRNVRLKRDKFKILHYLYLNGIDFHLLSISRNIENATKINSIYSLIHNDENHSIFASEEISSDYIKKYFKVISKDFDYQNNEHDHEAYRTPSFWKHINNIYNNNNNNNNNNNSAEIEQTIRVNEWKNRYEEHVLRNLSKMIQEFMLN